MARTGRPPKPTEVKRKLGNPGKRALPEPLTTLPRAETIPEPLRQLAPFGRAFWDRLWEGGAVWISPSTDIEMVQMICEWIDERTQLRLRVLQEGDWRERNALRKLDAQIVAGLATLGFTPTDRTRLGLAEVKFENKLDEYRRRKSQMVNAEVVPNE